MTTIPDPSEGTRHRQSQSLMAFGFFAAAACFFVAAARMEVQRPGLIAVGGLNFMLACAALLRRRRFAAHRGATPDDRIREDAQR